jgi:hypothetical protein
MVLRFPLNLAETNFTGGDPVQSLMKTMAPLKISIIASPANVIQCRPWNESL